MQEIVQPTVQPTKERPGKSWTLGFELFCRNHSYRAIAEELDCSIQAVFEYAKRHDWKAKRQSIQDRIAHHELAMVGPDRVVTELIAFPMSELDSVAKDRAIVQEQLERERASSVPDGMVIARLVSVLDMLRDRKRILLGIPLPGVRRNDAGGRRSRAPSLPVIDVDGKPTT